ncbi:AfsR/SARP family transcriptional regulator [Kitasatospora sp. CB01950]|uniref:AfsR/SARP family transcriptional regulator n=1 Tax=Kitasatospora sp. CB01950 TaxID=1703930 RepID=UPI001F52803D|nr:AfsR/SARP family transcriptional regulator [Kitasatospora sp. CB01950]
MTSAVPSRIRIEVLGPFALTVNGRSVAPTAGKPRTVLALLSTRHGRAVPAATLIRELWSGRPPASAAATLQTYIFQLRRTLRGAGLSSRLISTVRGGYRLELPSEAVDVHEYQSLAALGDRAAALGAHEDAARLLREALRLWRGPGALLDVERGPALEPEAQRLELSRSALTERRIDAELAIGRHAELLGELAALTVQDPMNERHCAQQMVALYRCGRRLDALSTFQRLRNGMAAELSVEPGPALRELHRAVIDSVPALDRFTVPLQLLPR